MKRSDFINIIKVRSFWKIDRRKGNYQLPNGDSLKDYVRKLVWGQMDLDQLVITEDGNLHRGQYGSWDPEAKTFTNYIAFRAGADDESCSYDEHRRRLSQLVNDIVG